MKLLLEWIHPGAIILQLVKGKIVRITVSDPSRKMNSLRFNLNRRIITKNKKLVCVWDHKMGISHITIDLPHKEYAGKSISFDLNN